MRRPADSPDRRPLARLRPGRRRAFAAAALPVALAASLGALCARPGDAAAQAEVASVHVHQESTGDAKRALAGVGWNTGDLSLIAPLRPPSVRIDAHLDRTSPEPGRLDIGWLLDEVAEIRARGGSPLVLLYPMPVWLGEGSIAHCMPGPLNPVCDPTRLPPSDPAAWEALLRDVVRTLATADAPAYRFEVWNEPETAVFWQGTRDELLSTVLATHRAVAAVAAETGLPLEVGGPASAVAPGLIEPYVAAVAAAGLPLDFVSWHRYGNAPFLGPDGNEGLIPGDLYRQLAGVNPATTPVGYGDDVERVRALVEGALADTPARAHPALVLDEWNLSAGGYDHRHDSSEGAAFDLGVLIELERAGADEADYYRAVSGSAHIGDWGLVTDVGARKPAWWVLSTWLRLGGSLLAVDGDDPASGLWARATRDGGELDVLLANFVAKGGTARPVHLALDGCAARSAEVRAIDADSPSFARATTRALTGGALDLELPAQSATWLHASCNPGSGAPTRLPSLRAGRLR